MLALVIVLGVVAAVVLHAAVALAVNHVVGRRVAREERARRTRQEIRRLASELNRDRVLELYAGYTAAEDR